MVKDLCEYPEVRNFIDRLDKKKLKKNPYVTTEDTLKIEETKNLANIKKAVKENKWNDVLDYLFHGIELAYGKTVAKEWSVRHYTQIGKEGLQTKLEAYANKYFENHDLRYSSMKKQDYKSEIFEEKHIKKLESLFMIYEDETGKSVDTFVKFLTRKIDRAKEDDSWR